LKNFFDTYEGTPIAVQVPLKSKQMVRLETRSKTDATSDKIIKMNRINQKLQEDNRYFPSIFLLDTPI
jgi:hypothetical protein